MESSCSEANSADGGRSCPKSAKRFSKLSLRLASVEEEGIADGDSSDGSWEDSSMLIRLRRKKHNSRFYQCHLAIGMVLIVDSVVNAILVMDVAFVVVTVVTVLALPVIVIVAIF